jgi:hypothetical protein
LWMKIAFFTCKLITKISKNFFSSLEIIPRFFHVTQWELMSKNITCFSRWFSNTLWNFLLIFIFIFFLPWLLYKKYIFVCTASHPHFWDIKKNISVCLQAQASRHK